MNRQAKRAMQKSERRDERAQRAQQARRKRQAVTEGRKERTGFRQFLRDVRQELRKVAWPDRRQLFTYTLVVLVTVIVVTTFVALLDMVIGRGIFAVFGV